MGDACAIGKGAIVPDRATGKVGQVVAHPPGGELVVELGSGKRWCFPKAWACPATEREQTRWMIEKMQR